MSDDKKKMKKERLTGLFVRTNDFGTYYTGKLADGTVVIVHPPFEAKADGPAMVLSKLVTEEEYAAAQLLRETAGGAK